MDCFTSFAMTVWGHSEPAVPVLLERHTDLEPNEAHGERALLRIPAHAPLAHPCAAQRSNQGSADAIHPWQFEPQHLAVQEPQRGQRLIPRRCGDLTAHREIGQKCLRLALAQLAWVAHVIGQNKSANPAHIGIRRTNRHAQAAHSRAYLIQQSSRRGGVALELPGLVRTAGGGRCRSLRLLPRSALASTRLPVESDATTLPPAASWCDASNRLLPCQRTLQG